MALPNLKIDYDMFLRKSTVIYGSTGCGKTTMIKSIMFHLKDYIPQVICFCPTDHQNVSYSEEPTPLVPPSFIHYTITEEMLKNIWDRQCALAAKYIEVNKYQVLRRLYGMVKNEKIDRIIKNITRDFSSTVNELKSKLPLGALQTRVNAMKKSTEDKLKNLYKIQLRKQRKVVMSKSLTPEEQQTMKMLDFDPNILLIFDDVTTEIKSLRTSKILSDILFKGRHVFITIIISLHDDTTFPPGLRTNTNNTFFADKMTAFRYYEKLHKSFSKAEYSLIKEYVAGIKAKEEGNAKLAFLSAKNKFFSYTADIHPQFTFGCEAIKKYDKCLRKGGKTNDGNKFYKDFKV